MPKTHYFSTVWVAGSFANELGGSEWGQSETVSGVCQEGLGKSMKNLGRMAGPCAELKPEHSKIMRSKLSTVIRQ
jgi:hypothetical protein